MNRMQKIMMTIALVILAAVVFLVVRFVIKARQSQSLNVSRGLIEGRLGECPGTPNCVTTETTKEAWRVDRLSAAGVDKPLEKLEQLLVTEMGARLVKKDGNYFHVNFVSNLFGFVDDFEAFFDETSNQVQFRSASRVGNFDFGANRKRAENLHRLWVSGQQK